MATVSTILIVAGKIAGLWVLASILATVVVSSVIRRDRRRYQPRHRRSVWGAR